MKKSNTMLYAVIGGGVLVLGACCICGGVGGFFAFRNYAVDPEAAILGKWRHDGAFGNHQDFGFVRDMEFKDGGGFQLHSANPAFRFDNGKWRLLTKKGRSISVEVSFQEVHVHPGKEFVFPARTETYHLTVESRDVLHRRLHPAGDGGIRYKRET
ncbi:MAG: hypothetical protein HY289_07675 [Planctomycetes bacterium]|nr:hypothetical protein [Planctomycetota bacterium]